MTNEVGVTLLWSSRRYWAVNSVGLWAILSTQCRHRRSYGDISFSFFAVLYFSGQLRVQNTTVFFFPLRLPYSIRLRNETGKDMYAPSSCDFGPPGAAVRVLSLFVVHLPTGTSAHTYHGFPASTTPGTVAFSTTTGIFTLKVGLTT